MSIKYATTKLQTKICADCGTGKGFFVVELRPFEGRHDRSVAIKRKFVCSSCASDYPQRVTGTMDVWMRAGIANPFLESQEAGKRLMMSLFNEKTLDCSLDESIVKIRRIVGLVFPCRDLREIQRRTKQRSRPLPLNVHFIRNRSLCRTTACQDIDSCKRGIGECPIADVILTPPVGIVTRIKNLISKIVGCYTTAGQAIERSGDWIFDYKRSAITIWLIGIIAGLGFIATLGQVIMRLCGYDGGK